MLLLVYIKRDHASSVREVSSGSAGCGIMGRMGNKGGVAIRLQWRSTLLCFINAHFAADQGQTERRNQNYEEICRRMVFSLDAPAFGVDSSEARGKLGAMEGVGGSLSTHPPREVYNDSSYIQRHLIKERSKDSGHPIPLPVSAPSSIYLHKYVSYFLAFPTVSPPPPLLFFLFLTNKSLCTTNFFNSFFSTISFIFWMGDLNYRIDLPEEKLRSLLMEGSYPTILEHDQVSCADYMCKRVSERGGGLLTYPPTLPPFHPSPRPLCPFFFPRLC